jgi:hypothetical protein
MWKRFTLLLFLMVALTAPAAMAQPVPDNEAVPDPIPDAPRQQVVSAITGQLPGPAAPEAASGASTQEAVSFFGSLWPVLGTAADDVLRALANGNGNVAAINQVGTSNRAEIAQRGQSNVAVMLQYGSGNVSTLLQDGSSNVYGSLLNGTNNTLDVEQVGHNNTYLFGFQGSNLNHSFEQIGNGNTAVQIGVSYQPFGIQQRGNNMNMTIRHNGAQ